MKPTTELVHTPTVATLAELIAGDWKLHVAEPPKGIDLDSTDPLIDSGIRIELPNKPDISAEIRPLLTKKGGYRGVEVMVRKKGRLLQPPIEFKEGEGEAGWMVEQTLRSMMKHRDSSEQKQFKIHIIDDILRAASAVAAKKAESDQIKLSPGTIRPTQLDVLSLPFQANAKKLPDALVHEVGDFDSGLIRVSCNRQHWPQRKLTYHLQTLVGNHESRMNSYHSIIENILKNAGDFLNQYPKEESVTIEFAGVKAKNHEFFRVLGARNFKTVDHKEDTSKLTEQIVKGDPEFTFQLVVQRP